MAAPGQALASLARIGNQAITSADPLSLENFKQYIEDIKAEGNHTVRWQMLEDVATQLERLMSMSLDGAEIIWEVMSNDTDAWKTTYSSFTEMQSTHITIKESAERAKANRSYRDEAVRGIQNAGILSEDWTIILPPGDINAQSATLLRAARSMTTKLSSLRLTPSEGIRALNHLVFERVCTHRRGGALSLTALTTDYQKAAKLTEADVKNAPNHADDELAQYGLMRGASGLIQPLAGQVSLPGAAPLSLAAPPEPTNQSSPNVAN